MGKNNFRGKYSFCFYWIILNTIGWGTQILFGWFVAVFIWFIYQNLGYGWAYRLLMDEFTRIGIVTAIVGLLWGTIMGWLQHLILSRDFKLKRREWVFATIIGISLHDSFQIFPIPIFSLNLALVISFLPPLFLGLAQWVILRKYFLKSWLWILASTLALRFGSYVTSLLMRISNSNLSRVSIQIYLVILSFLVSGFFYGAATWLVLKFISRHPNVKSDHDYQELS